MQGKTDIAQPERGRFVGVASHHGGRGQSVSHARSQLVDAIAARRIPHQKDPVGINTFQYDQVFDNPVKKGVDMTLMPEVPRIGGGAGGEINAFFGQVSVAQAQLVDPLFFVDLWRGSAAAMH